MSLGKGSLLAKIDIKSAYHLIPISPRDRLCLGMQWNNAVYVDGMLPFGLRSAPKIFNALADGLEWCKEGVQHIFQAQQSHQNAGRVSMPSNKYAAN